MNYRAEPQKSEREVAIKQALRYGPLSGDELSRAIHVSQPTLSRAIHKMVDRVTTIKLKGSRAPLYGMLRELPAGLSPRQKIYRFLSAGNIIEFADVEFLSGGGTVERTPQAGVTLYEGLPPYIAFAAPSGFLGRQRARDASLEGAFPESLKDWSDEHRVHYLFTQGLNLPGNLVFGDVSLQREMDLLALPVPDAQDKLSSYVAMAQQLKGATYGSSAGGEQPKFLWQNSDTGPVIIKFARAKSRMADLLPMEHLALKALREVGIETAETAIYEAGGYVFLEVVRYDRVGSTGRKGMLSAGAIDDEFFGQRDNWVNFADRCLRAGYLSQADADYVYTLAAFSELIGNTDRHFENISLLIDEEGEYAGMAPAYDILPMTYVSIGGGIDPDYAPIKPKAPIGAHAAIWSVAAHAADVFWTSVATEEQPVALSDEARKVALTNREVAAAFAGTFLPGP